VETPSCLQFSAPLRFALVRNGQMPPANPVECGVDFVRTVVSTPCRAAICTQILCVGIVPGVGHSIASAATQHHWVHRKLLHETCS